MTSASRQMTVEQVRGLPPVVDVPTAAAFLTPVPIPEIRGPHPHPRRSEA
jgi:hypothetical protein